MKTLIPNYQFDKTAKTVTFTGMPLIESNRLLLITDTTTGTIIYNFASSAKGGTVNGNVLTLTYDTSSLNSTDSLQIFYDLDPTPDEIARVISDDAEEDAKPMGYNLDGVIRNDDADTDDGMSIEHIMMMAMNKGSNTPLQVQLPTDFKVDANGAQIFSDMPAPIRWTSPNAFSPIFIDCAGYSTVLVSKTTTGIVTPTVSNDKKNFYGTIALPTTGSTAPATTIPTTAGIYILPVVAKWLQLTGPASAIDCTIYLSQAQFTHFAGLITQSVTLTGLSADGVAPATNPIPLAGKDDPNLTGIGRNQARLGRSLVTDNEGRLQIGKKFNFENVQRVESLARNEGMSQIDILDGILLEMKINNYLLYHMPCKIVQGIGFDDSDDPSRLRNDESFVESDEGQ